jgi:hypothetical protein
MRPMIRPAGPRLFAGHCVLLHHAHARDGIPGVHHRRLPRPGLPAGSAEVITLSPREPRTATPPGTRPHQRRHGPPLSSTRLHPPLGRVEMDTSSTRATHNEGDGHDARNDPLTCPNGSVWSARRGEVHVQGRRGERTRCAPARSSTSIAPTRGTPFRDISGRAPSPMAVHSPTAPRFPGHQHQHPVQRGSRREETGGGAQQAAQASVAATPAAVAIAIEAPRVSPISPPSMRFMM